MDRELEMVECAVNALQEKMAHDVVSLHVGTVTAITDYFVIATGNSKTQIDAMVDGVEESMKDSGYELIAREGKSQGGWILLDYNDVVIHIFDQEMREFYNLDNSWRDVERKTYLD